MKFNLYSVWTDPVFLVSAAVFAAALVFLVFAISKYLEIKNGSGLEEETHDWPDASLPAADSAAGLEEDAPLFASMEEDAEQPSPRQASEGQAQSSGSSGRSEGRAQDFSKAEEFIKGLYANIERLDGRMKNIEAAFSKAGVNRDFTVTFLEDILDDFDSLGKEKLKARIEYLVSDLKK